MLLRPIKNESELLLEIVQGNEESFSDLFYGYHQQLGNFVFSITGNAELSEEIVQDVFLKIWTNRDQLLEVKDFSSYLYILSRNHTLNEIRKLTNLKKKDRAYNDYLSGDAQHAAYTSSGSHEEADYLVLLDHAICQLPPQQQKVLLLKQQGYKNAEVASQLDLSLNSVKKYQQWAYQAILKFVKARSLLSIIGWFF